jgi:hypothetical protein
VLIRHDQHIAWRGDAIPDDALALIDRIRGAQVPGKSIRRLRDLANSLTYDLIEALDNLTDFLRGCAAKMSADSFHGKSPYLAYLGPRFFRESSALKLQCQRKACARRLTG